MIYDRVETTEPIRQGDIFQSLPQVRVNLSELFLFWPSSDGGERFELKETTWTGAGDFIVNSQEPITLAALPIASVNAIAITQSRDAQHADHISLCQIVPLSQMRGLSGHIPSDEDARDQTYKYKAWLNLITCEGTDHLRWFYLPPGDLVRFDERMGVDFHSVFQVPRSQEEEILRRRVGRLSEVACEHFREKLAQFFRRYPYDPWYPLNRQEFDHYQKKYPTATPYDWQ